MPVKPSVPWNAFLAEIIVRADAQKNSCVADASSSGGEVRKRRRISGSSFHSRNIERAQIALATTAPAESYTPPPAPPVSMPAPAVPAHGIIITPRRAGA